MTTAGRRDFRVFNNFNNTSKSYELLHVTCNTHADPLLC